MVQSSLLLISLLAILGGEGGTVRRALDLATFAPRAIAVPTSQQVTLEMEASELPATYLVVVGSLSPSEPAAIAIELTPVSVAAALPMPPEEVDAAWQTMVRARRQEMTSRRQVGDSAQTSHFAARFAEKRSFHLFVREDDFLDRESYQEVQGDLIAVGEHCLVYVDAEDRAKGFPVEVAYEVSELFDKHVLPNARKLYGRHCDIDRNGRFTILFTHWLANLSNGKVSVGGFVRGSDFLADLAPPFSNQCDMMYLNSDLRPGEHLRTLIAHEYTHAVTFSEHTYGEYLAGYGGEDEETWLSEAMAHLAENFIGSGWSNLDYRVSAYLNAPYRYRLVVPDYYRAGLWRCHGSRGATFLFLRWCVDKFGPELLEELSRSNLQGVANLEAATETPFAELFRQWSVAMCLSGISPAADETTGFHSLDLRDRLESRLLAGPRFQELAHGREVLTLEPTSWRPLTVRVPPHSALCLKLEGGHADMQVTLVRLPDNLPRIELTLESSQSSGEKLIVHHREGPIMHWTRLALEPASLPQTKSGNETAPTVAIVDLEQKLKSPQSRVGESIVCPDLGLTFTCAQDRVVKIIGIDANGNRVSAWATIPSKSSPLQMTMQPDSDTLKR